MKTSVLIIEDEKDIRELLLQLLKIQYPDWKIWTAPTIKEALCLVEKEDFSLVISDCILPDGLACDLLPKIILLDTSSCEDKYQLFL